MVRIKISSLKPGLHDFELAPEAEALSLDPERFSRVQVEAHLDVHAERILAELRVRATATLECDRTLQLFDQELTGTYRVLYASDEVGAGDEQDVRVLRPSDQEIDLTEPIRDTLLLAVPTRCIAPGAENLEIPTQFGEPGEEAIDPRWEALRALRSGNDEE